MDGCGGSYPQYILVFKPVWFSEKAQSQEGNSNDPSLIRISQKDTILVLQLPE